jgi:hypothetical protein
MAKSKSTKGQTTIYKTTYKTLYFLSVFDLRFLMAILEKQELLTLPQHLSSPPVFSGVRVTRSLILYVCFVDRCLSFCVFGGDRKIFEV